MRVQLRSQCIRQRRISVPSLVADFPPDPFWNSLMGKTSTAKKTDIAFFQTEAHTRSNFPFSNLAQQYHPCPDSPRIPRLILHFQGETAESMDNLELRSTPFRC